MVRTPGRAAGILLLDQPLIIMGNSKQSKKKTHSKTRGHFSPQASASLQQQQHTNHHPKIINKEQDKYHPHRWSYLIALVAVILPSSWSLWQIYHDPHTNTHAHSSSASSASDHYSADEDYDPLNECTLVMAKSGLPNAGFGMFTLVDRPEKGYPITSGQHGGGGGGGGNRGDVVIQVMDLQKEQADGMRRLLHDYLWRAELTGGQLEGQFVYSALPGTGMLANSGPIEYYNVAISRRASVCRNGTATHRTPYAGAVTEYRNASFYTVKPIRAGEEIMIDYGRSYMDGDDSFMTAKTDKLQYQQLLRRPVSELRSTGLCLDHIRASDDGYGAVAARFLPQGTVVAPVPVVPVTRTAMGGLIHGNPQQLMMNYCYGHADSSLLLFPYAPTVNLINHALHHDDDDDAGTSAANVRLQWSSTFNQDAWWHLTVDEVLQAQRHASGLVLELVATRDITPGEDILLDYGAAYQRAWERHVRSWTFAGVETPSYMLRVEDGGDARDPNVEPYIRTLREQLVRPYPRNVLTMCLYRYHGNEGRTRVPWSPEDVGPRHWRPCHILERQSVSHRFSANDNNYYYTVAVENRPHMPPEEVIQNQNDQGDDQEHVVTDVPAAAIRLADEPYTTDQHLANAFRHEIHIPDDVFPEAWKDLRRPQQQQQQQPADSK